jgi:putative endopeptidase
MSDRRDLLVLMAVAGALCVGAAAAPDPSPSAASGIAGVDGSVRPGDDFYAYANGAWIKATPRPEGLSVISIPTMLQAQNARRVRGLIEDSGKAKSGVSRKIADYYASRLDAAGIEARGVQPLAADLAAIAAISDRKTLSAYLGGTLAPDDGTNSQTEGLFGLWVHQDFHDPDHYAAHLVQGGLGLTNRDDYLGADPAKAERRTLYQSHVAAMLRLAGLDQPDARAARVLGLEVAIAGTHAPSSDLDDVFKTDHSWRRADFDAKAPGVDWAAYFKAADLGPQTRFNVWQPSAVIGAGKLVAGQPLEAWRDYLAFHLIEHRTAVLPKAFGDARLAFEGRLSGAAPQAASQPQDRQHEAQVATEAALGDAVGKLYVERYFPPQAKAAAEAMVANIRTAFRPRLAGLTWMSPETKAKALEKLTELKVGLGYPDTWVDYSGLAVARGDAYGNQARAERFAYRQALAKLSRPADPGEWAAQLHPQMVNAFLNISPNSIAFAAGVLQPPWFDPAGDTATNYGSAGAGISHEISHTFDEVGNLYDARGRLGGWWTKEDLARYQAASAPLAVQLSAYCPARDLCVNGKQALGETTADLAGLLAAHDAYLLALKGKPDVVKDGLTGEQRFFLAFSQRWRRLQSDASLRRQIATDTHAPGDYRSLTVRNAEAWVRAYDVKPGDRLYLAPKDRVQIW